MVKGGECMQKDTILNDVKRQNRQRIAKYILENKQVSRQELAKALGYSMPTIFANVNELMEQGFVCEAGEYGSTGGRKAKVLTVNKDHRSVIGLDITKRHIRMLLLDITGEILREEYFRFSYEDDLDYYQKMGEYVQQFVEAGGEDAQNLIGVGISLPGIIVPDKGILQRSHILNVADVSLNRFSRNIPYPVIFDNDANCAAYVEVPKDSKSTAYFSLSNTVGGAIYYNGSLCQGDNYKSGEFGHMIIRPGGKMCYCGKKGCLDAYCSALTLTNGIDAHLEEFFENLAKGDIHAEEVWDDYLDNLAIAVSNIRMAFDCDIILGGYIGGYVEQYMVPFTDKVRMYNNFDTDTSYITTGKYKRLASAIGAAQLMVNQYIDSL